MDREIESMNSRCLASLRISRSGDRAQLVITTRRQPTTPPAHPLPPASRCISLNALGYFRKTDRRRRALLFIRFVGDRNPLPLHICRSWLLVESIIRGPIVTVHVHAMHARIVTPDKWEIPGCQAAASPRYTRWRFQRDCSFRLIRLFLSAAHAYVKTFLSLRCINGDYSALNKSVTRPFTLEQISGTRFILMGF